MWLTEIETLRRAVVHLERYRGAIEAETDRRLGREEPPPEARLEIVRRFRSFSRLAMLGASAARPSLDGLGAYECAALERAVATAVQVALECGPAEGVGEALRALEARFRAAMRNVLQPHEPEPRRRGRRRMPNAGHRVRSAIDRISDAYLALNLETGKVFDVNPAAETLFGTDAQALLERELVDLVSTAHRAAVRDLEARLDAGEDTGPCEVAFARPGGDTVAVELHVANHTIAGKRFAIFTARERATP